MRMILMLFVAAAMGFGGCATSGPAKAPSTSSVKSKINQASSSVGSASKSVSAAKAASQRSSDQIKGIKSDAQQIDDKTIKILQSL